MPDWITHIVYTNPNHVASFQGPKEDVLQSMTERHLELVATESGKEASEDDSALQETVRHLHAKGILPKKTDRSGKGRRKRAREEVIESIVPTLFDLGLLRHPEASQGADSVLDFSRKHLLSYVEQRFRFGLGLSKTIRRLATLGLRFSRDGFWPYSGKLPRSDGEPIVQMEGVKVRYGENTALGNWQQDINGKKQDGLWWTVRRGQRWGVFGPNGMSCSFHSIMLAAL